MVSATSSTGPAVTVSDGVLYVAWTSASTDTIYYSTLGSSGWTAETVAVSGATAECSPRRGSRWKALYLGWKGTNAGKIWHSKITNAGGPPSRTTGGPEAHCWQSALQAGRERLLQRLALG